MIAVISPGLRGEGDAGQRRLLGAGILERDVLGIRPGRASRRRPACGAAGSTISGATSSTWLIRAADADARGSITNIAVTMNTAKRICIAYWSDAIIAPTCIAPCVDPVAAEPDDGDAGQVEHHDQRGHQERDQPVDGDRRVRQIEVRLRRSARAGARRGRTRGSRARRSAPRRARDSGDRSSPASPATTESRPA